MLQRVIRGLIALGLALVVSTGLFLIMASMTARESDLGIRGDESSGVEFVRLRREAELQVRERQMPQPPPPPDNPPPPPKLEVNTPDTSDRELPDLQIPNLQLPAIGGSGPGMAGYRIGADARGDRGLIPRIQIPPQYPQRALIDGIEGRVTFELLVGEDGSVLEAEVVEYTDRIFIRPAQRAIYRWRFEPRLVEGNPVPQRDRWVLEFSLTD